MTVELKQTNENNATVTNENNVTGVDIDLLAKHGGDIDLSHIEIDSSVFAKQVNDTTIDQSGNSVSGKVPAGSVITQDNTNKADVSNENNVTGVDIDLTAAGKHSDIDLSHVHIDSFVDAEQHNTTSITQHGNDALFA